MTQTPKKIIQPSPLDNPLSRQKLRYHKVTDILIRPVGQVTGNTSPDRYV